MERCGIRNPEDEVFYMRVIAELEGESVVSYFSSFFLRMCEIDAR
jgi:hypothetical protein